MTGSKKTLADNIIHEHEETQGDEEAKEIATGASGVTGEQGDLEGEQIETIEIVKSPLNQQSATQHDTVPGGDSASTTAATPLATVATTPPTEQTLANLNRNLNNNQVPTTLFPFVTVEVDKPPEELNSNNIKKNDTKNEPPKPPTLAPATTTTPITKTTTSASTMPFITINTTPVPATTTTTSTQSKPRVDLFPQLPVVSVDQHLVKQPLNESKNTTDGSVKKHLSVEQSNEILKSQPNDAVLIPGENRKINHGYTHPVYQDQMASKRTQEASLEENINLDNSFEEGLSEDENTETITLVNKNDNFIQDRNFKQHAGRKVKPYTPNPNVDEKPKLNTPPSASNYAPTTYLEKPPSSLRSSPSSNDEKKFKDEKGDKRAGVSQHYSSFTESEEDEEMLGGKDKGFLQKEDQVDSHTPPPLTHPTKSLNLESHLEGLIRPTMVSSQFIVSEDDLSSLEKKHMLEEKGKGRQLVIPVMNNPLQTVVMSPMFTTVNQPQDHQELQRTTAIIQQPQPQQVPPAPAPLVITAPSQPFVNNGLEPEEVWQQEMNMEDMYWTGNFYKLIL